MELLKRLNHIYASAGRLLDFSGSYNRDYLMQRLSVPGYLRDREAFLADRNALQEDVDRATRRLEDMVYGRLYQHRPYSDSGEYSNSTHNG